MEKRRKPFQGVLNIIRFNWHFYAISAIILCLLVIFSAFLSDTFRIFSIIFFSGMVVTVFTSLLVSFYIYDVSNLYKLTWLDTIHIPEDAGIININAGFDETSELLFDKFKVTSLTVFDFYDPARHTEVSIKRARKAYPPYPGTQQVNTTHLPVGNNYADAIFAVLSAHEIRNEDERKQFFSELNRVVKPGGKVIVTEHLQDLANFVAYNIGFFHFHTRSTWLNTFTASGLKLQEEIKITPFISTFILEKNGSST